MSGRDEMSVEELLAEGFLPPLAPRKQPTRVDFPCLCDDEWVDECPQHVSCDLGCKALNEPSAAEEWKVAAQHWRSHGHLSGCSHGN